MSRPKLLISGLVGFSAFLVLQSILTPIIGTQRRWIIGNLRLLDNAKRNPEAREAAIKELNKRHQEQDARAVMQAWALLGLSLSSGVLVTVLVYRSLKLPVEDAKPPDEPSDAI